MLGNDLGGKEGGEAGGLIRLSPLVRHIAPCLSRSTYRKRGNVIILYWGLVGGLRYP